jgi:hypothetical protein
MHLSAERLQIGDRVGFSGSSVHANGVVIEDLGPDYVRVQWLDCRLATTHRRHALERQRATRLSKWTLNFRPAKPQQRAPIAHSISEGPWTPTLRHSTN